MGNKPYRQDRAILEVSSKRQKIKNKRTKELNAFMVGLDGAGKSSILYKHMASSTYSSTCMTIPKTITYNVETIRPKISFINTSSKQPKRIKPPMAPIPPPIHSTHQFNSMNINTTKPQCSRRKSDVVKSIIEPMEEVILLNIYDFGGSISTRHLWTNFKRFKIKKLENTNNRIDFFILVIDCTDSKRLNDEYYDSVQLAMKELLCKNSYLHIPLCIFANKQDLNNSISSLILPYRLGIKQITIWNLIANVKYVYNINLQYKISKNILSYLPNPNYYWNMNKRHWIVFDTQTVNNKYCKGIHNGIQWLYNQYYYNKNIQKRMSFTPRFKMTM